MDKFLSSLSLAAQCQLDGLATVTSAVEGGRHEVQQFCQELSEPAQAAVSQAERGEEILMIEDQKPCYCMVECKEGEFPLLRIFSTINGLVSRVRLLEGKDVCVYPFWGIPLPFTQEPDRALILPGKSIRISDGVDVELDDAAEIQEDAFLGLPELSIAPPSYIREDEARAQAMRDAGTTPIIDSDDDDDDEVFDPAK